MQASYKYLNKNKFITDEKKQNKTEMLQLYCCNSNCTVNAMQAKINKCAEHFKVLLQKEGLK